MAPPKALTLLQSQLDSGCAYNSKTFRASICQPAKKVELWKGAMVHKFGSLALESAYFARVLVQLMTLGGLSKVSTTIAENIPLHGLSNLAGGLLIFNFL